MKATNSFELTADQAKHARRLLDLASAYPSQSAGVVLGQVLRDYCAPGKIILTLAVIGPGQSEAHREDHMKAAGPPRSSIRRGKWKSADFAVLARISKTTQQP